MNDAAGATCAKCGTANPAGSKFCSSCGAPMGAGAPPPPPPPRPRPMPSPGQFAMGKVHARQVSGAPGEVYDRVLAAVQSMGGEVRANHPGQMLSCVLKWKNLWITGGMGIAYDTDITVEPAGADMTTVRVSPKVDWSSTVMLFVVGLVLFVLVIMLNPLLMMVFMLLAIAGSALTAWGLSSMGPKELAEKLFAQLPVTAGVGFAPAARPSAPTPTSPTPTSPTPTPSKPPSAPEKPAPAAAADEEEDVMDRIAKLASLRDAGAITEAEFDAKKAELLARI